MASPSSLYTSAGFTPNFHLISGRSRAALPVSIRMKTNLTTSATRRSNDHDHEGYYHAGGRGAVDEDMIVLRRRIHDMKIAERNFEPPSSWMGWEKEWFAGWDGVVFNLVGILQVKLMNTRPGFALGFMALLALSVSFSTAILFFQLVELSKVVSSQMLHMIS